MQAFSNQTRRLLLGAALLLGMTALGTTLAVPDTALAASDHAEKSDHKDDKSKSDDSSDKKPKDKDEDTDSDDKKSEDQDKKSGDDKKDEDKDEDKDADKDKAYESVKSKARKLSKKEYEGPSKVSSTFSDLDYEQWGDIHFKDDKALWRDEDLPFQAMFYHPGYNYAYPVKIHTTEPDGHVSTVEFDKDNFEYPDKDLKKAASDDTGYAGVKLLYDLTDKKKLDEVLSFLGASYFRGLGADNHYGLSARGLAIDTGNTDKGEEFPSFTEFWLVEPEKDDDSLRVYALLESPSVTGAYKFVVEPGSKTVTHIDQTLYVRKDIDKLGIAPLTSMFTWGENSLTRLDDYRPEVHDSDGMLIALANGEWLWKPLANPQQLAINQFSADDVKGFGLMQRDRDFDHYQDLDYEYEKRPNAWITPRGDWGKGELELVEIPSDNEVNDNIALYWIPKDKVKKGQKLHFSYDITWSGKPAIPDSTGHAVATHIGMDAVKPGEDKNQVRVVVDFKGGDLPDPDDDDADIVPKVNAMRDITLNDIKVEPNPHIDGWRLSFLVPRDALDKPLELRAYLADDDDGGLTETWNYILAKP